MPNKLKVFVSSTSDMKAERRAVRDALRPGSELFLYEELGASGGSPKQVCEAAILSGQVFLGVLGAKYGSPYREDSPGDGSVVEWEFNTARSVVGLEIMMFIKEPSPGVLIDDEQRRFIAAVEGFETGVWRLRFRDSADLVTNVYRSMLQWYADVNHRMEAVRHADRSATVVAGFGGAVAVGGLPVFGLPAVVSLCLGGAGAFAMLVGIGMLLYAKRLSP